MTSKRTLAVTNLQSHYSATMRVALPKPIPDKYQCWCIYSAPFEPMLDTVRRTKDRCIRDFIEYSNVGWNKYLMAGYSIHKIVICKYDSLVKPKNTP